MPKPVTTNGHVHKTLALPDGYQHYGWYKSGEINSHGVCLNPTPRMLQHALRLDQPMYLYTQHQIAYQDGILKQTRSSPNWDGGMVTYSTCKHNMRTYQKETWVGTWLAGLCPKECENNCLLFVGRVHREFNSNYGLSTWLENEHPEVREAKLAINNPRGDLYTPSAGILKGVYNHRHFKEPLNHTRSVEFYEKSPGSTSERADGKIPKWWRDIEYLQRGVRPPSFILSPCFLFSRPTFWSSSTPGRAVVKMTTREFDNSLQEKPC